MHFIYAFIFIAFFAAPATPVMAGQNAPNAPSGGMHYTRIKDAPVSDSSYIKLKTIQPEDEKKEEKPEDAQVRIWNKYKALAAGKTEGAPENDKKSGDADSENPESTAQKTPPEKTAAENEPAREGGIAGLITEYRRNKAQRSQMRSITVTKPAGNSEEPEEKEAAPKEKPAS